MHLTSYKISSVFSLPTAYHKPRLSRLFLLDPDPACLPLFLFIAAACAMATAKEIKPKLELISNNHYSLVERTDYVYFRVVAAANLRGNRGTGTCEPFVELRIGNFKGMTRCVGHTSNPRWDEVFAFRKDLLHDTTFQIAVRDRSTVDAPLIGRFKQPVGEIPQKNKQDSALAPQWYRLLDQGGLPCGGDLMLAMWQGDQTDAAFRDAWLSESGTVNFERMFLTRRNTYIQPRLHYMRVRPIEARDLVPPKDLVPEVYVKAKVGETVLRTKVSSKKGTNPSWNEELIFVVAEPFEEALTVSLEYMAEEKDKKVEFCLGRYVVPLCDVAKRLLSPPNSDKWVVLQSSLGKEKKQENFASRLKLNACMDSVYHVFDECPSSSSDFQASSPKMAASKLGVLEIGILKAEGLQSIKYQNGLKTPDAYCVAKFGRKWNRTSTIANEASPKWNEQFIWDVVDPYTMITIGVFDNCNLRAEAGGLDSIFGKVRIRLCTLETDRIYANAYPLIAMTPEGKKKMGELHLTLRFRVTSTTNLLHTYLLPLLPRPQLMVPLSVYQLNILRQHAVHEICLRLGRSDPPLRREVVEIMLDARGTAWSMRRAKANLNRVKDCLKELWEMWTWFQDIRAWKNPMTTIAVFFALLILFENPGTILPSLFVYHAWTGMCNYRSRPRHPPCVDTALSLADNASAEDMDEEFDTFPSCRPCEVIHKRYDRLRSHAAPVMTVLGDFATQLERVRAMLSWRDPRASAMFVAFCVLAAVMTFVLPSWLLFGIVSFAVLRPPKFRTTLPSIFRNFLRRMPAKNDIMI